MIKIDITKTLASFQKDLDRFTRDLQGKAIVRALNTTANSAKIEASRDIRNAGYQLKATAIKKSITVYRATISNLKAEVVATGKGIPRIAFNAKQTAKGVTYAIKGPRVLIPSAFVQTMKSGHRGVFKRKPGTQMGKRGQPIQNRKIVELWGPSIPTALMNSTVKLQLEQALRTRFPRELAREIRFIGLKGR